MKILLIGNGGREHALAWKIKQSPKLTELFVAPGNPGTAECATNVAIDVNDFNKILTFVQGNAIDLVVIGPEDPLAGGLADQLIKVGVKVFGPTRDGARLEADKWFAKELMRQQSVPTAEARSFTNASAAEEYVKVRGTPIVIKAAGLAKGKGVAVCYREEDAIAAIHESLTAGTFGDAGRRIVIEEFMRGPECSILAFVDRRSIYLMETAQDHKTIFDDDTGPMTGGMGAYSPTPFVTGKDLSRIEQDIFIPVLDGLIRDDVEYRGVLYAGLMMTTNGPRVLEFNCRFGDPETQPLMMRLKSDLVDVMLAVAEGRLDEITLEWDPRPAMCVVASSAGYPGTTRLGDIITGIEEADAMPGVKVFQSGTSRRTSDNALLTAGGRVLAVTAIGDTLQDARDRCYTAMTKINFEGKHIRTDIGNRALR